MWEWIKNLFSDKEEEGEKINKEIILFSASDAVSADEELRFRFQLIDGKYNLIILSRSNRLYRSVYEEATVKGNTGNCYLKTEDENFKIMTGRFSIKYPYTILTIKDVNLSDFLDKNFTKCRIVSRSCYIDTDLDVDECLFSKKLKVIIRDMLKIYEILTTNLTKDL